MKNLRKDAIAKIQGILVVKMGVENERAVSMHDEHKSMEGTERMRKRCAEVTPGSRKKWRMVALAKKATSYHCQINGLAIEFIMSRKLSFSITSPLQNSSPNNEHLALKNLFLLLLTMSPVGDINIVTMRRHLEERNI